MEQRGNQVLNDQWPESATRYGEQRLKRQRASAVANEVNEQEEGRLSVRGFHVGSRDCHTTGALQSIKHDRRLRDLRKKRILMKGVERDARFQIRILRQTVKYAQCSHNYRD